MSVIASTRPSRATVAERYAKATQTSDLTTRLDQRCDADVLLAAGYAASGDRRKNIALHVYRMTIRQDLGGLAPVVEEVDNWLKGRLSRKGHRPMSRVPRQALILTVLRWWMKQACEYCNGTGYEVIEDTGRLSGHECSNCHGTGKTPIARIVPPPMRSHAEWLAKELDSLVLVVQGDMAKLLAENMSL